MVSGSGRIGKERGDRDRRAERLLAYDGEIRRREGVGFLAGVDEVGRGPLAGPVLAAAVILPTGVAIPGANDSKQLDHDQRVAVARLIRQAAIAIGYAAVRPRIIDRINILEASRLAMRRALAALDPPPSLVIVDGWEVPCLGFPQVALPRADATSLSVACASILAKVRRDAMMVRYARIFPQYDFARNKGYPTPGHLEALGRHGPCLLHRQSFAPVAQTRIDFPAP